MKKREKTYGLQEMTLLGSKIIDYREKKLNEVNLKKSRPKIYCIIIKY